MDAHAIWENFKNFYETISPISVKTEQTFAVFSDIPNPLFNAIMEVSYDNVDALLEKAPVSNPISIWLHPYNRTEKLIQVMRERNFAPLITCPLLAWAVKPTAFTDYDIRPAEMGIFHDILADVYQFDAQTKLTFQNLMEKLTCENYIIYQEGIPVGTGTLFHNSLAGGIFNDATLPNRREASVALTQYLMQRAFELNLEQLIVLSSPEGEKLYKKLGFKNLFNIEILQTYNK